MSTNLVPTTPIRRVVPPLNLSMESLTPYADEDITVTSGYEDGRSPATPPGHLPLIQIEPESGRIPFPGDTNTPPELRRR
jgi:hypothetical protein